MLPKKIKGNKSNEKERFACEQERRRIEKGP